MGFFTYLFKFELVCFELALHGYDLDVMMEFGWERFALEAQARFPTPAWQTAAAPDGDVAVCSRTRFARNLVNFPFPHSATLAQRREISNLLQSALSEAISGRHETYSMASLLESERDFLVGQRLISPEFASGRSHSYLVVDQSRSIGAMVNEEDHLRLQTIMAGCQPVKAVSIAEEVVGKIGSRVHYAYHPDFGYVTASPYNAGNGMRISVMVQLIGLMLSNHSESTLQAASDLGIVLRGVYGEGSNAAGGFVQISSVGTINEPIERVREKISGAVYYLIEREREARSDLPKGMIENRVESAMEAVKKTASLKFLDCLRILSWIRLAAVEQLLGATPQMVDRWAALVEIGPQNLDAMNRRRASFLKSILSKCNI